MSCGLQSKDHEKAECEREGNLYKQIYIYINISTTACLPTASLTNWLTDKLTDWLISRFIRFVSLCFVSSRLVSFRCDAFRSLPASLSDSSFNSCFPKCFLTNAANWKAAQKLQCLKNHIKNTPKKVKNSIIISVTKKKILGLLYLNLL